MKPLLGSLSLAGLLVLIAACGDDRARIGANGSVDRSGVPPVVASPWTPFPANDHSFFVGYERQRLIVRAPIALRPTTLANGTPAVVRLDRGTRPPEPRPEYAHHAFLVNGQVRYDVAIPRASGQVFCAIASRTETVLAAGTERRFSTSRLAILPDDNDPAQTLLYASGGLVDNLAFANTIIYCGKYADRVILAGDAEAQGALNRAITNRNVLTTISGLLDLSYEGSR